MLVWEYVNVPSLSPGSIVLVRCPAALHKPGVQPTGPHFPNMHSSILHVHTCTHTIVYAAPERPVLEHIVSFKV